MSFRYSGGDVIPNRREAAVRNLLPRLHASPRLRRYLTNRGVIPTGAVLQAKSGISRGSSLRLEQKRLLVPHETPRPGTPENRPPVHGRERIDIYSLKPLGSILFQGYLARLGGFRALPEKRIPQGLQQTAREVNRGKNNQEKTSYRISDRMNEAGCAVGKR